MSKSTRAYAWFVFLALLLLLRPMPVLAYVLDQTTPGNPLRWPFDQPNLVHTNSLNPSTHAIRYHIASDAWSAAHRSEEIESVRASFDPWQAIPGVAIRFEFAGLVPPETPLHTSDHTNLVYWTREDKFVNGGRDDIRFSLALTYLSSTNGVIHEADIVLNGRTYSWFTNPLETSPNRIFVESTMLHEIGHLLGLDHSPAGGATMFPNGGDGIDAYLGLSSDDIAAARALYGRETDRTRRSSLHGRVTLRGEPLPGAVVALEDIHGNLVAANPTRIDGTFEMAGLDPGTYQARIFPLDPNDASQFLARGRDLSTYFLTNAIQTQFAPVVRTNLQLLPGTTLGADFEAISSSPSPRITSIRIPGSSQDPIFHSALAALARPGQSNLVVGVFSPEFPVVGGVLRVTGTGIRVGPTQMDAGGNLRGRSALIQIDPNAVPGMRSLLVEWPDGSWSAAHGFLDIQPASRDDNFDGFPDEYQRLHFPRFTAPEASPAADPDGDGADNAHEYASGTDPQQASSVFKILSVEVNAGGGAVRFLSLPGKRYRLFTRDAFPQGE